MAHNLAIKPAVSPLSCAGHVVGSLLRAEKVAQPFNHWMLDDVLPEWIVNGIGALPFAPPEHATFDGRRESNNSTRVYFSPKNQQKFDVCREVADAFRDPAVLAHIEATTGRDVSSGHLRIEYCQDIDGFWLEPHVDISAKLFTMLVYLSADPDLADAGTDIFDATPEHNLVGAAPYARNKGLIFIPGDDTWHGFSPRPIKGLRTSIIVNYVKPEWRATEELA